MTSWENENKEVVSKKRRRKNLDIDNYSSLLEVGKLLIQKSSVMSLGTE